MEDGEEGEVGGKEAQEEGHRGDGVQGGEDGVVHPTQWFSVSTTSSDFWTL